MTGNGDTVVHKNMICASCRLFGGAVALLSLLVKRSWVRSSLRVPTLYRLGRCQNNETDVSQCLNLPDVSQTRRLRTHENENRKCKTEI